MDLTNDGDDDEDNDEDEDVDPLWNALTPEMFKLKLRAAHNHAAFAIILILAWLLMIFVTSSLLIKMLMMR